LNKTVEDSTLLYTSPAINASAFQCGE